MTQLLWYPRPASAGVRSSVGGKRSGNVTTDGVGARWAVLAAQATDTTARILPSLAKGQDRAATDVQTRIDDWSVRLKLRQQTLTRQFTATKNMLSSLKNQSSWLWAQIGSLARQLALTSAADGLPW